MVGFLNFLLLVGIIILIWRSIDERKRKEAMIMREKLSSIDWPSLIGEIRTSDIVKDVVASSYLNDFNNDGQIDSEIRSEDVFFYPRIEYIYTVGGVSYDNNCISFGPEIKFRNEQEARTFIRRYPEWSPVTVYYDPDGPANSVLER